MSKVALFIRILVLAVITFSTLVTSFTLVSGGALAYTPYTVKLDSSPWNIIVNPATNTIYVSHVDAISVIDGSNYDTVATIQLGENDYIEHMAINPLTNTLYATARDSNVTYVIDTIMNTVVDVIPARGEPQGVAVNPSTNLVYVANAASGKSESYDAPVLDNLVSVIDGATSQVVADIDVGGRFLSEEGITRETEGIGVNRPTTISIDPGANMVYVGGGLSEAVVVIDGSTNEVVARIVAEGSHMRSSIDLMRSVVYFSNSEKGKIDVVNSDSNTLYYSIDRNANGQPFSFPEDIAINAETNKLYVADMDSVSIIDPDSRQVTKTLDIGGYKGIAIFPERNLIFVTVRDSNSLIIVNGQTDEMVLDMGTYTYEIVGVVAAISVLAAISVRRYQKSRHDRRVIDT